MEVESGLVFHLRHPKVSACLNASNLRVDTTGSSGFVGIHMPNMLSMKCLRRRRLCLKNGRMYWCSWKA